MSHEHIVSSFDIELERIRQNIMRMGGEVESQLAKSIQALARRDSDLARRVMEQDANVDALEAELEESTVKLMALRQPMADDLKCIARICRLAGGMPLAILLAAAWTRMLSPAEIAAEIAGGLGQAIDLLETDWHGVPARQRSMRAVFDHSYALLSAGEREVLEGYRCSTVLLPGWRRN